MSVCLYGLCRNEAEEKSLYCAECKIKKKEAEKRHIVEGVEEGKFEYENSIICPHCGHNMEDYDGQFYEEGEHEAECTSCDKKFRLETQVNVTYSTYKDVEEDEE